MNKWIISAIAVAIVISFLLPTAGLAKENIFTQEELAAEETKDHPNWIHALKIQHHLTEDHILFMKGHGLSYPQIAIASRLSEKSGKTVDDLLEMRSQKKMNWDKIAEELEVDSSEGVSSLATIRKEITDNLAVEIKNARND